MKFLFLLGCAITVVTAAPNERQPLDKWNDISEKVAEIRFLVTNAPMQIIGSALSVDLRLGAMIIKKLQPGTDKAHGIFLGFKAAIDNKSLTLEETKAKLEELKQILPKDQVDIAPLVQQLTGSVQAKIKLIFDTTIPQEEIIADQIRALLA